MKEQQQEALAKKEQQQEATQAAEAKKAQEKKLEEGYNTGITFNNLARSPKQYKGKKVEFKGQVIQVIDNQQGGQTELRVAVNGNYNNVILVGYDNSITSKRVLDNDNIIFMGLSNGLTTYTAAIGGEITIPSVIATNIIDHTAN